MIEIVHQRAPPRRGYSLGTLTLWLAVVILALALLGCTAHAQTDPRNPSYEHFQGRDWRDEVFRQRTVVDTRIVGSDGRQRHCRKRKLTSNFSRS